MTTTRDARVLGVYVMPGPATDTLSAEPQALEAERIGLGAIWYSELQGPMKDAGAVLGYLAHATERIRIGTSIHHFGTRHPMVQASWGATMQTLSGGRFEMGFGRSVSERWKAWGISIPTTQSMGDYADILRRLWNHETVSYEGPAGSFPHLHLGDFPDFEPPPLLLAAIGPNSMALVGRSFDGVLLHPFTSIEGLASARATVRAAAEQAGRDPDAVRIIHQVVTAPDCTDEQVDQRVRSRIAAYLNHPEFGNTMAAANGWDLGPDREDAGRRGEDRRHIERNVVRADGARGTEPIAAPGVARLERRDRHGCRVCGQLPRVPRCRRRRDRDPRHHRGRSRSDGPRVHRRHITRAAVRTPRSG